MPRRHARPVSSAARHPRATAGTAWRAHFVDGAFAEVVGSVDEAYRVEFVDTVTDTVVHHDVIRTNHWIRTTRQYWTPWRVDAYRETDGTRVFTHTFDGRGQRVYVALESKALGDTLAWLPAVDAFRRRHRCRMICSTFLNPLFREEYPEIEFIEPGVTAHDLYAMYRIGWFPRDDGALDPARHPRDARLHPLGATAFDILGLPFEPTRPRLAVADAPPPLDRPYVCVGIHATAQAKYWNHPTGWDEVVRYLRDAGYEVVLLSREGIEYMGNRVPDGVRIVPEGPLATVVQYLRHARLFIGVGSGLSWLAWAAGCPTCLISGFSLPNSEMPDAIRISPPPGVCSGCYNRHRLAADDWNWCPEHAGSPRMFECTRTITGAQVIEAIRSIVS